MFLLPAIKGLIDAWLASDGENTEILSLGLVNVARPIIEKQQKDKIVSHLNKLLKYNPIRSMALRQELGKYIQVLKEENQDEQN